MIPQRTVDTMRQFVDVSVHNYGIDCILHVPNNQDTVVNYDVYVKPSDWTYDTYKTVVWIDWSPNKYKLRKLGLFVENDIPILAWFKNRINNLDVDIEINSWFKIDPEYIPNKYDTEEFEIVDILVPSMHDAVITKYFKIAPRRLRDPYVAGDR